MDHDNPIPERESIISPPSRAAQLSLVAHGGFLLIGIVNTLLGPILPLLSARWQLDDAQAGQLFTAQFAGGMTGSAISGILIKRLGFLPLMVAGFGVMSAAIACLGLVSRTGGVVSFFGLGVALGLTIPATNLLIADLNPERRAAALNVLNLVWGLGATLGPLLVSWLGRGDSLTPPLFMLSGLLAGMALLVARYQNFSQSASQSEARQAKLSLEREWSSPFALLTGALVFVYVGTETATAGWIASYAQRLGTAPQPFSALTVSLFWAGLLAGRSLAPAVLRRISEGNLVLISLLVAIAGLGVILAGSQMIVISAGAMLAGLGLAAVFPTTFAIFTQHFGARASQLAGAIFILASLGGAVIPWLVGITSARYGDLRTGLWVPLLGGVVMVTLQIALISLSQKQRAKAS